MNEADDLDRASELEEQERQSAIQAARASIGKPPIGFDGLHCSDCEDEIEEGRLQLGKFRCYACQVRKERRV